MLRYGLCYTPDGGTSASFSGRLRRSTAIAIVCVLISSSKRSSTMSCSSRTVGLPRLKMQPQRLLLWTMVCATCGYKAGSLTALGVHEHKKHGTKIVARRFASGAVCNGCHKSFHTRPRLLLHLQYGTTRCLVHCLRSCTPIPASEVDKLDLADRNQGVALHQKGLVDSSSSLPCFSAEVPPAMEDPAPATPDELVQWSALGSLPSWLTGLHGNRKEATPMEIVDPIEDLKLMEQQWCKEAVQWKAPAPSVPRALSECHLYFLVFFSGH